MLCDRLGVSERWACRVVGQHRSTQRHEPKTAADDAALVMLVARSIDADTVVATLERLVAERGAPELLRCDNGPEMTAHALRDWCELSKTETAFIEPGSPWQNPFVESFHSRVRDELLDGEEFSCLAEARVVIGDWREDYNWRRPHSALAMKAPAAFAAKWAAPGTTALAA
jgi:putative transposase